MRLIVSVDFFFFLRTRPPPESPLFPYPTLFRSIPAAVPPDPPGSPLPTGTTGTGGPTGPVGDEAGGCGLAGRAPNRFSVALALALLLVARRRRQIGRAHV